jgi:hypothetical protein
VIVVDMRGGPLDEQKAVVDGESAFYWLVDGRLVANTAALPYEDVRHAQGIYTLHRFIAARKKHEVLIWRAK